MVKTEKLKCGVTLVTEHMPAFNSTAFGVWVKTGAVNETREIAGISHFIEHMMFKGTKNKTAKEIAESVDEIGGQINAFTGKEATCYYIRTLAENLEKSMDIILDMITKSLFDREEMEREKNVIYEEMKMIKDAPDEDALDTIGEIIFKDSPLGNSVIGTRSSLKKITRQKLLRYLKEQYTRDSIVVSVAGKFDEKIVREKIDEYLSDLNPAKSGVKYSSEKGESIFKVKTKDIEQSHICLATRSLDSKDKRYYALSVLNNIIGGSMSSRLFQNVREQKGLAYSVYSGNNSYSESGFFNIYAGVSHDKIPEAISAIKEELIRLADIGVTKEELNKAKIQLKAGYIYGLENVNARMFLNGKSLLTKGKVDIQENVLKDIDSVKLDDIEDVKKIICDIDSYSGVLVTSRRRDLRSLMRR